MFTAEFIWFSKDEGKEVIVEADFSIIPRSLNPDSDWDAKDQIDLFSVRTFDEDGQACSTTIPDSVIYKEIQSFICRAEVLRECEEGVM